MSTEALFHLSLAVDNLDRAREFYGKVLGCPEGRKLDGRADFNFFGHHIVTHCVPEEVIGMKGAKVGGGITPLRHFGAVVTLDKFKEIEAQLRKHGAAFLNEPKLLRAGEPTEQMLMTVTDGCGNAVEFKGVRQLGGVFGD